MAWYSFATYKMPWLYPYAGPASIPWFTPFSAAAPPPTVTTLFSQEATGSSLAADATAYTFGMNFELSQAASPNAIWWYSPAGAAALPSTIAIFEQSHVLVHSESATWSGVAGSGWVRAAFASPPSLQSSASNNYFACVLQPSAVNWYSGTSHYWDTGPGAGGITVGIITAFSNSATPNGQDVFNQNSTLGFPGTSFNATNYWVDIEFPA